MTAAGEGMVEYLPHVMWAWAVLPFVALASDVYDLVLSDEAVAVADVILSGVVCAVAVTGVVGLRRRREWGRKLLLVMAYFGLVMAYGAYLIVMVNHDRLSTLLLWTVLAATGGVLGDRRVVAACNTQH